MTTIYELTNLRIDGFIEALRRMFQSTSSIRRFVNSSILVLAVAASAAAQTLPSDPVTFAAGRVVLGGDVAVAVAPPDHGFFNYGDYEQTTLRQVRLGLSGQARISDRLSFLGELRSDNLRTIEPFALYARIRPFPQHRLDIQAGRIPPTFGSFTRRTYSHDNPLIGLPLAYQYLTSLRPDVAPGDADELLRMRARGWRSSFTYGNQEPARGVPLVSALTWDTGVQLTTGWKMVTVAAAVTTGTASRPLVADDNAGKQLAARVSVTPATGLVVAGSFARGEFLSRDVRSLLGPAADPFSYAQRAAGADVEYSRDRWMVRADAVFSEWQMPLPAHGAAPFALRAAAVALEGRYTFLPGFYGAARAEHLAFNRIAGAAHADEWDAPVTRFEIGGGAYLQRNLTARVSLQTNLRDGGRVTTQHLMAAQLLYWF
jgi:hypothetical protein